MDACRIRSPLPKDAAEMATLFFETVHAISRRDYSPEQLRAWAPEVARGEQWAARQAGKDVFVAVEGDRVVGFAELDPDGHIDCFYTHKDRQSRGIGSLLLSTIEGRARDSGIPLLTVDASITAKAFFEHRGFRLLRRQEVLRRGVALTNFRMDKTL